MEIVIKSGCVTTFIRGQKAEDFQDWLDHECNGAKPTRELFEEFLELEEEFRQPLINACNKYL